jgi:hypothetical protein
MRNLSKIALPVRKPLAIIESNFPADAAMVAGAVVIYLILRTILSTPDTRQTRAAHA